ncbi:MAG: FRG domain-containing protein [Anaerolineales bacterium]|nr:FRG domain-containing protein [Anaerolineales bacterium]
MDIEEINDWDHFAHIAERLSRLGPDGPNIFRGQANHEWLLRPSITRILLEHNVDLERCLEIERKSVKAFQEKAHLFEPSVKDLRKDDILSWWEWMQHYGAPTRLLDWTVSPYVALYFAVENLEQTDADAALFRLDAGHLSFVMDIRHKEEGGAAQYSLKNIGLSLLGNKYEKSIAVIGNPLPSNRMVAQRSSFTVCTELLEDHDKVADSVVFDHAHGGEGKSIVTKYIVKRNLKHQFLANLEMMNINASTLFPGIDGLGKSIKELIGVLIWRGNKK